MSAEGYANPPAPQTAPKKRSKREERALRWGVLKTQLVDSKGRTKKAKTARKKELEQARDKCQKKRKAVTQECAADRTNVRQKARGELAREKALREDKRGDYRYAMGQATKKPTGRRYSAAESDSLAEHSVPRKLVGLWRKHKAKFSRSLEPDHRAELFQEWVEEHPRELIAWQSEQAETIDYGAAYAAYSGEQEEAIPF